MPPVALRVNRRQVEGTGLHRMLVTDIEVVGGRDIDGGTAVPLPLGGGEEEGLEKWEGLLTDAAIILVENITKDAYVDLDEVREVNHLHRSGIH